MNAQYKLLQILMSALVCKSTICKTVCSLNSWRYKPVPGCFRHNFASTKTIKIIEYETVFIIGCIVGFAIC